MKQLVIFYLSLCAGVPASSQSSKVFQTSDFAELPVKSLTVEDGLPQGFINGIRQDSLGFIWLGTREGLARYDGRSVKVFRSDINDSSSLAGNVITTIYADHRNNIWIIYENNEVDVLNPSTEAVRHLSREPEFGWMNELPIGFPARFVADKNNKFWFISDDGQLRFFSFEDPFTQLLKLAPNEMALTLKEDGNSIWVLSNKSLYRIENGQILEKVSSLPKPFSIHAHDFYKAVGTIVKDVHNHWVIGGDGFVQIFNQEKNRWQVIPTNRRVNRFFAASKEGAVYFNSDHQLCRLNDDHSISVVFLNKPEGFISMMIDRSNVLWIGTNTYGAKLLDLTSRAFRSFRYKHGFFNDAIRHLLHINMDSTDWQSFNQYAVRTAVDKSKKIWTINLPAYSVGGETCYKSNFAFFTNLNKEEANVVSVNTNAGGTEYAQTLAFDDYGRCWTTNYAHELVSVNLSQHRITGRHSLSEFHQLPVYLTSSKNRLFVVFSNGLMVYDIFTGKVISYKDQKVFRNTNLLMGVTDRVDTDIIWLASMGNGLIKFNVKTGVGRNFTEREGVPSNTIYGIVPDGQGFLWCSSNKGVFKFHPRNHSVVSFKSSDGLQGDEFNRYHFLQLPDGRIAFGGTRGWTVFHPDSIQNDHYKTPVAITKILVKNTPLEELPSWKHSSVSAMDHLILPYNQNFITFYFSGLQYNEPSELQYRYKMVGIDDDWIRCGNLNMANYTSLPPGSYTFRVNCSNTSSIWSDKVQSMKIVILPPWWQTWWARLLFFGLLIGVILFFYRYHINLLQSRQKILVNKREAEYLRAVDEMKSRFFSNITHEFRTPLSLIVAPVEEIKKDHTLSSSAKSKLSLIQQNANKITHLINQLLDISKLEAGSMKMAVSRGELKPFMEECFRSFQPLVDAKKIDFSCLLDIPDTEYVFDFEKLEKIIHNLLSNAVKFTPEEGSISITVKVLPDKAEAQRMLLDVQDSGAGIPAEKLPHIFDRFYQAHTTGTHSFEGTGIGLALVKEFVVLLGGTIQVQSDVGAGTVFQLSLPVQPAGDSRLPVRNPMDGFDLPGEVAEAISEKFLPAEDGHQTVILVVDDHLDLAMFIAETLKPIYKVLIASNGVEGLRIARDVLPDIIISDVMMPGMDGFEFCRLIKSNSKTSHISFVILSAKASHDSLMEGLIGSADEYLTKPFHVDELHIRVRNLLDHQKKMREYYNAQLTMPELTIDIKPAGNEFLKHLYCVLEENLDDVTFGVEMLARLTFVSVRTLNRKLKNLTGLPPHDIILQYRLKRAASLIKRGYKIADIAYAVGFSTPSYFTASFKAFYGCTPSQYYTEIQKEGK